MNILVLELDSINAELSGVGQTALKLSKAWLDARHGVSIIMPKNWPDYLLLKEELHEIALFEVERSPENKSLFNMLFLYIARILQSFRYILKISSKSLDFIFADYGQVSLVAAYFAKTINYLRFRKKPIIVVSFYHLTPRNASYQKKHLLFLANVIVIPVLMNLTKHLNARFFTESTYTGRLLSQYFKISENKVLPIGGGIDDAFIKKLGSMKAPEKQFDACFIGRIHPAKGIFDLVRAWKTVRTRIPEAKLAIIGGGYPEYRKMIEKLIGELDLRDNITLLGQVSDEEKFKTLKKSKFLVHPAYEECVPLTFFEAASMELPIITYYLPTYENIIECLIPVRTGYIEQLANTLADCISTYNTSRKAFYYLLSKEKELATKHTWKNIAKSLLSETGENHAHSYSTT